MSDKCMLVGWARLAAFSGEVRLDGGKKKLERNCGRKNACKRKKFRNSAACTIAKKKYLCVMREGCTF